MKRIILFLSVLVSANCYGIDWVRFENLNGKKLDEFTQLSTIHEVLNQTDDLIQRESLKMLFVIEAKTKEKKCLRYISDIKSCLKGYKTQALELDDGKASKERIIKSINDYEELYKLLQEAQVEIMNQ